MVKTVNAPSDRRKSEWWQSQAFSNYSCCRRYIWTEEDCNRGCWFSSAVVALVILLSKAQKFRASSEIEEWETLSLSKETPWCNQIRGLAGLNDLRRGQRPGTQHVTKVSHYIPFLLCSLCLILTLKGLWKHRSPAAPWVSQSYNHEDDCLLAFLSRLGSLRGRKIQFSEWNSS